MQGFLTRLHGVVVALDALTYIGRAITPTAVFRRFNTRFYLADGWELDGRKVDQFQGAAVSELRYRKRL